ncbi:MAG: sulfide/dihydroorotate dehydrogenase-like FAD/NAD-binding protein [Candidatus Omnitrophica bacterium]|nr:sulfide/dihydroorotate dehydrogenase-like FAD/NAD-binding protein [Candidatus Omnitrophota bacterium]
MKILKKDTIAKCLGTKITMLVVHAPLIAAKIMPGQFVVVMAKEQGERIPLTVVDKDPLSGAITLIIQEIGFSTRLLSAMSEGEHVYAVAGPMGHATPVKKYGNIVLVGGGLGIAELYPIAAAMKKAGNHITVILGAKTKELLILEEKIGPVSDILHIATDDGSYGMKGFVTGILTEVLNSAHTAAKPCLVYAVGPVPMMKSVSDITKKFGVKTIVSLNALMVDATGMCGGCRVKIGGQVKFSCVDGPEFDAHLVDWDELINRSRAYADKEEHICRLGR